MKSMKAMVYDGYELKEVDVEGKSYNFLHDTVGGWIEHIPMGSLGDIDMWGNDEAKLMGLPPTIALMYEGKIYDIACGNLVFMRHNAKGETLGLRKEDIEFLRNKFESDGIVFTNIGFIQTLRF